MSLAPCPCGRPLEELFIAPGSTDRWRYVTGNCCGEWMIEVRVSPLKEGETVESRCEQGWNNAPRANE